MKTLAMISQKGGAGKSTLAAHLAVAFEDLGIRTVIIDLDDQGSVTRWGESRTDKAPLVVSAVADRLPVMLKRCKGSGVGLVIIDTPPHTASVALSAASHADLIAVPTRPAIFDLRSIDDTQKVLTLAGAARRAAVVLNAVRTRGSIGDEAEVYAERLGLKVIPCRLGDRVAFADALIAGQGVTEYEPKGKAASELLALADCLARKLKLISTSEFENVET